MKQQRKMANGYGIFSLWANWLMGVGSLILVMLISLYIDKYLLPLVVLILEFLVFILVRHNRVSQLPVCYLIPFICTRVLFWSAVIMVIINTIQLNGLIHEFFDEKSINPEIPFISGLIIAPVTLCVSAWAYKKGVNLNYCVDCVFRHGTAAERGFLGNLFSQEGRYQVKALVKLFLLISVIVWVYYSFFYINVNLNDPDKFFFVWLPILLFVLSAIYLGFRYFGLWSYYCQNIEGSPLRHGSSTYLRYIIFCGDYVFLHLPNIETDDVKAGEEKYDTPARLYISYRNRMMEYDAESYFKSLSGISDCEMKLMYVNTNFNADCNIFHYACIVDEQSVVDDSRLRGNWFTAFQINEMIRNNQVASIFASEFNRLYKITMAWKTYDRSGRRLYNIKNYKPTFRLRDIKDWTVDYNDNEWLFVSINNEDKPFYRIKRFWRKHVNGIGD